MSVTGTIGGNEIAGAVRSLKRRLNLCAPGQQATLILDSSFSSSITVSDPVELYENDVKVFTGYVTSGQRERPSYDWTIECVDTYTRALSYFIGERITTGHDANDQPVPGYTPQLTDYWEGYLLGLCELQYEINSPGHTVPAGVQIGLRTVHESLQDVMTYASQYAYCNRHGVLQIGRVARNSGSIGLSNFISYDRRNDDEWTRTNVKVYGYASTEGNVFANAYGPLETIIPDRVTAVASPMIGTNSEAQRIADYLLEELGSETIVVTGEIVGNPYLWIGQSARMGHESYSDWDVITSLESDYDDKGYVMRVTIGERCPRIAGWSRRVPKVYAGTTRHGVYKSDDGGASWATFNAGLPTTGNLYVPRLAFNAFDEGVAIVNNNIYYTDDSQSSGSWSLMSLATPAINADDTDALTSGSVSYGKIVAVDAVGIHQFAAISTALLSTTSGSTSGSTSPEPQQSRSWYWDNTGSNPASLSTIFTSTELKIPELGEDDQYNVRAYDLSVPYIVASEGDGQDYNFPYKIYGGSLNHVVDFLGWDAPHFNLIAMCKMGIASDPVSNWWANNITLTGIDTVNHRAVANIFFRAICPFASYRDNVFMFGTPTDHYQAEPDSQGYYAWEFQLNFVPGPARPFPVIWGATYSLPVYYPSLIPLEPFKLHFGFFYSPHGSYQQLMMQGITTGNDTCDSDAHSWGLSPYGDTNHQGFGAKFYPYPFKSLCGAGTIVL